MIVDIGGGTTDIAVIALSGVVQSDSIKVAGDKFNEAVIRYIRKKHSLLVGERTAEEAKIQIGRVYPTGEEKSMSLRGRDLINGLPREITITSGELMEAFAPPASRILEAIHGVLERTPPELVGDISANGITMTGGGSLLTGFDTLIQEATGIETRVAEDAVCCVARGTGMSLDCISNMKDGTVNFARRRQMNS